ncbi:MAG TPA: hypothetical protein VN731_09075 [Rhodanobacter sp.]|nr:hypothetical protein [Rhodanobacter sp.]
MERPRESAMPKFCTHWNHPTVDLRIWQDFAKCTAIHGRNLEHGAGSTPFPQRAEHKGRVHRIMQAKFGSVNIHYREREYHETT